MFHLFRLIIKVSVGDIGDLYKIRIEKDTRTKWSAWHLDEVIIIYVALLHVSINIETR